MQRKNNSRLRLERLAVGATMYIKGAMYGSAEYLRANNYVNRVRLGSSGTKTFSIKSLPKSLAVTRLT